MAKQYKVTQSSKLLTFLFEALSKNEGWSKKAVKQRLQGSSVSVNAQVQTKHDFVLSVGDIVEIGTVQRGGNYTTNRQIKLEIIHQDQYLIAINKPSGLLSVGTAKENKQHALAMLRTQLSRGKNSVKLWPVHRLDRDTSGILLFATSKEVREAVMDKWDSAEKVYLAVVDGKPKVDQNTITEPLRLDEQEYRMHVGKHSDAKPAITHYKVKESTDKCSLLEVRIETGRQHQIRAHMAWMGHPVIGDERYGIKGELMGLHAMRLCFVHPLNKRELRLKVDAPREFYGLMS